MVIFAYFYINIASIQDNRRPTHHYYSKEKACLANIRLLMGAVEMYNMDSSVDMKTLDLNILKEKGYLKNIVKPESECEYYFNENVYEVKCVKHGGLDSVKKSKEVKEDNIEIWSWIVNIEKFFYSIFSLNVQKEFVSIILTALGLASEVIVSCGGIVNFLLFITIISMFRKSEEEDEPKRIELEDV